MSARTTVLILILAAALSTAVPVLAAEPDAAWAAWQPLVGEWVAEGGGAPGAGSGLMSFATDLDGDVLVRRNRVDYPATAARAALHHEDLLVHFHEAGATRAIYFDNEGHVIRYLCRTGDGSWTCDSEGPGPLYRLVYGLEAGALRVSFAIAPSGKAEDLKVYAAGTARRQPVPPG